LILRHKDVIKNLIKETLVTEWWILKDEPYMFRNKNTRLILLLKIE